MRYALAVLTHGDNAETLAATITSFDRQASEPPVDRFIVQDGPCALPPSAPYPWVCLTLEKPSGFCRATKALWELAVNGHADYDYVFWLEHDFKFRRSFNLQAMADILSEDRIAQVSLMRGPVNSDEHAAGGVVQNMSGKGFEFVNRGDHLRHHAYFTTNPSLMRRRFMWDNPWPDFPDRCEGRYGINLISHGYDFAIMGDGEPWIEHIGKRTGFGY